jgi:hypothetical protein
MSQSNALPTPTEDYTDEPIYWFAVLDRAVERGDHAAAADAQRQLDRLGVRVRYGRQRRPGAANAGGHHDG